jgi:hypothetical protein
MEKARTTGEGRGRNADGLEGSMTVASRSNKGGNGAWLALALALPSVPLPLPLLSVPLLGPRTGERLPDEAPGAAPEALPGRGDKARVDSALGLPLLCSDRAGGAEWRFSAQPLLLFG